uniref:Activin_recp domain-containing protein n=1 Tax=Globodera pallida TaxID=36090 RepID=A0A183C1J2_GLOPA
MIHTQKFWFIANLLSLFDISKHARCCSCTHAIVFVSVRLHFCDGLKCLYGKRDADGIGEVKGKECQLDDANYCFKANCDEGNGQIVHSEWGCSSPDIQTNCAAVRTKVAKALKTAVNCECLHGQKDADLSNTNLIKTPTTTTEGGSTSSTDQSTSTISEGYT